MKPDLTDEETDALARLLRNTIDADRFPFSPRVQMWKGIFEILFWRADDWVGDLRPLLT